MSRTWGPWEVDDENCICAQNAVIAAAFMPPSRSDEEWDANARLIAAAPDLLNAVYIAHGTFARQLDRNGDAPDSWGDDEHEAFGELKDAIAKVEGR